MLSFSLLSFDFGVELFPVGLFLKWTKKEFLTPVQEIWWTYQTNSLQIFSTTRGFGNHLTITGVTTSYFSDHAFAALS